MAKHKLLTLLTLCGLFVNLFPCQSYALTPIPAGAPAEDKIHYIAVNPEHTSDAFLVESDGQYLLVDTSNPDMPTGGAQAIGDNSANVDAVVRYLRALGIESLDYVVLTHSHSDHIGGVTRLCREGLIDEDTTVYYRSNQRSDEDFLNPDWENGLYLRRALDAMEEAKANVVCLAEENVTELTLALGNFSIEFMNLDLDKDGTVDFHRENENNNSIVLMVTKGTVDTLLTGDIEEEIESALLPELQTVEVLKAPHHGNRTSSSYEFLKTLQPEAAINTAFTYCQYGAYEYMKQIGTAVYTTGLCHGPAIVEVVKENSFQILNGDPLEMTSEEGWHTWLDHDYYTENGQVVRGDWKRIGGTWYYFDEDGIMATEKAVVDGKTYFFREDGAWIRNPR